MAIEISAVIGLPRIPKQVTPEEREHLRALRVKAFNAHCEAKEADGKARKLHAIADTHAWEYRQAYEEAIERMLPSSLIWQGTPQQQKDESPGGKK